MDTYSEKDENECMSFRDLDRRQKLFDEQFQDLLKDVNAIKLQSVKPQRRTVLTGEMVEETSNISKQQPGKHKQLLKEHKECTERIDKLDKTITELNENLKKFKEELSVGKEELKETVKPLLKAINKYSTNLDMKVDVRDHENENMFVATVKFSLKENDKSVDFVIDRKQRCVLDFNASSIMSKDEENELKTEATTESGLDMQVVLKKLRGKCT